MLYLHEVCSCCSRQQHNYIVLCSQTAILLRLHPPKRWSGNYRMAFLLWESPEKSIINGLNFCRTPTTIKRPLVSRPYLGGWNLSKMMVWLHEMSNTHYKRCVVSLHSAPWLCCKGDHCTTYKHSCILSCYRNFLTVDFVKHSNTSYNIIAISYTLGMNMQHSWFLRIYIKTELTQLHLDRQRYMYTCTFKITQWWLQWVWRPLHVDPIVHCLLHLSLLHMNPSDSTGILIVNVKATAWINVSVPNAIDIMLWTCVIYILYSVPEAPSPLVLHWT